MRKVILFSPGHFAKKRESLSGPKEPKLPKTLFVGQISRPSVPDQPDTKYQLLKFRQAQRATLQLSFVYVQK